MSYWPFCSHVITQITPGQMFCKNVTLDFKDKDTNTQYTFIHIYACVHTRVCIRIKEHTRMHTHAHALICAQIE